MACGKYLYISLIDQHISKIIVNGHHEDFTSRLILSKLEIFWKKIIQIQKKWKLKKHPFLQWIKFKNSENFQNSKVNWKQYDGSYLFFFFLYYWDNGKAVRRVLFMLAAPCCYSVESVLGSYNFQTVIENFNFPWHALWEAFHSEKSIKTLETLHRSIPDLFYAYLKI